MKVLAEALVLEPFPSWIFWFLQTVRVHWPVASSSIFKASSICPGLSRVMLPPLLQSNLPLLPLLFLPPTVKVSCDYIRDSLVAQWQRICLPMQEMWDQFLGWEDPLEKEKVTDPRSLRWEIPWTEEPGRLQSMRSQRVGHNSVTK